MRTLPLIPKCGPLCPYHEQGYCKATNRPTATQVLPTPDFPEFCVLLAFATLSPITVN